MKLLEKLFLAGSLLLLITACNNNGHSLGDFSISIGNIVNPDESKAFYINLDNGKRLWTAASAYTDYRPKDSTRILANYTILADVKNASYDYDVKLNEVYEVLTKPIFNITPEIEDSIGNDPVGVRQMWTGCDYLNVEFVYYGAYRTHFINLVPAEVAEVKNPEAGHVYLEFRHNANNDSPRMLYGGYVSFELASLKKHAETDKLMLHVFVKESDYNTKEYKLEYKIGHDGTASAATVGAFHLPDTEKAIIE
ncbi:MAG: NigD-like protein [Prevotellaceae bacterium]|jgi:hypothetical protein|nr:NigD-like protein [Prevotellaceae bacterium]